MTPAEALAAFAEQVAGDEPLRTRLAALRDHATFAETCVAAAAERGLTFAAADVRALLQERYVFWLQRHIE